MSTTKKGVHREEIKPFEIKPSELIQILDYKLKMPIVPTIFIWGGPGIGKTHIIKKVASMHDANVIPFRTAYRDPTDIKGFPSVEIDKETGERLTGWARPKWFPLKGTRPQRQMIFADEVNRAPAMTMNALMELFEERSIEEFQLDENTIVIAACNREQDGGGINRMPQALCNRGLHFYLIPDPNDWYDWAADNEVHPMIFAYLKAQSDALYVFSATEKAFPTPRTWVKLSDCMKQNPPMNVLRHDAVAAVGYEVAQGFLGFVDNMKMLPTIDGIWLNPDSAPVPDNASALYAVVRTLARAITSTSMEQALVYLKRCPQEYQVIAIKDAIDRDASLSFAKGFAKFTQENKAVLA